MTPGERAAKRYETMRGLAKLDYETVYELNDGVSLRCTYHRIIKGHCWYSSYKWWIKRGKGGAWKRLGYTKAIDRIREAYEADDEA